MAEPLPLPGTIPSSARALQHYQQQQQPSIERSRENSLNSMATQFQQSMSLQPQPLPINNGGEDEVTETMQFCKALRDQVDTMDNRMRSNLLRGRSIINDSAIHHLFAKLTDHHANVLSRMTKLETDREYFESLQDHLAHIQESRQAVNALRDEHERQIQARLRDEQRQRQQQMQQKVEIMRQKRQELLLFQRHQALQRFQEHEQQIQQRRLHQASPHGGQPAPTNYGGGGGGVQPQVVDPSAGQIYQQQQPYGGGGAGPTAQPTQYPMAYAGSGGVTPAPPAFPQQQQWIQHQHQSTPPPMAHDYSGGGGAGAGYQPQYGVQAPYQMPPYAHQPQPHPQQFHPSYHHQQQHSGYQPPQQQSYAPMGGAYPPGQMPAAHQQPPPPQQQAPPPQEPAQEEQLLISFD